MTITWKARPRLMAGVGVALALLVAGAPAAGAKATTKKVAKKATTKKRTTATTVRRATTTAPRADVGPAKNITGQELAPGETIKLGIQGSTANPFSGDVPRMYEIALDALRKKGQVPVNGRDIVIYNRSYDYTNAAATAANQRATCTALAQDDRVFVALAYSISGECLAADNKIPTIGGTMTDEAMARAFPYAFAIPPSSNAVLENAPHWAESEGLLKGRKLGFYHGSANGRSAQINSKFEPQLKRIGYSLAEDIAGDDDAADRVAVQRFKASGVNTIFATARVAELMKAGQAQGYKPKYVFVGGEGTTANGLVCDGCPARAGMPASIANGTLAMATVRAGEDGLGGNPAPAQAGVDCASNYEKFSGERVRKNGDALEQLRWQSVQWSCIQMQVLVNGLKAAGPKLTQGSLINALETDTKGVQSGFFVDISFSRTTHFGSNQLRTVALDAECMCWKVKTPLRDYFVK